MAGEIPFSDVSNTDWQKVVQFNQISILIKLLIRLGLGISDFSNRQILFPKGEFDWQ